MFDTRLSNIENRLQCSLSGKLTALLHVPVLLRNLGVSPHGQPGNVQILCNSALALAQLQSPNDFLYVVHGFPLHLLPPVFHWRYCATCTSWYTSGDSPWYISGDSSWYTSADSDWYTWGDSYWYILARPMTCGQSLFFTEIGSMKRFQTIQSLDSIHSLGLNSD